jgi:hypothetical protein
MSEVFRNFRDQLASGSRSPARRSLRRENERKRHRRVADGVYRGAAPKF